MTTADEFVLSINRWAGVRINWNESGVIWSGAHDGGEILGYLRGLIRKIEKAQAEHEASILATHENLEG